MEKPGESKFNLETLRRIASAFDVALEVRFVPFSDLVDWSDTFHPDEFRVASFKDDFVEKKPPSKVTGEDAEILRIIVSGGSPAPSEKQPTDLTTSAHPEEPKEHEKQWLGYTSKVTSIASKQRVTIRKRKAERRLHANA